MITLIMEADATSWAMVNRTVENKIRTAAIAPWAFPNRLSRKSEIVTPPNRLRRAAKNPANSIVQIKVPAQFHQPPHPN